MKALGSILQTIFTGEETLAKREWNINLALCAAIIAKSDSVSILPETINT